MSEVLSQLEPALRRPLRSGADARAHEVPWRGAAGTALAVAVPVDESEVRAIVRWARTHRVRLLPQGAVTGLVGASTPPPGGPPPLVVSTDGLLEPLEVRPTDAVAVAGAGVRLSALNDLAGRDGLELPVELAADPSLGAMVATNTGGSRVLRHGDMSTHLLGVRAVLADEEVSVVGDVRGLHKDNTGPDPTRLIVGSAGAFGIVTAVAVRLTSRPADRATALVGPCADEAAVELLAVLRRTLGDDLSAFEVMCPAALAAGLETTPLAGVDPGEDPEVTVLVEASGRNGAQDRLVDAVDRAALVTQATSIPVELAWRVRHGITEGLRRRGEVLGLDLCVRPGELPRARASARELVRDRWPSLEVADFGHWGDGGIHCNVVVPDTAELAPADREAVRRAIFSLIVDEFDGSWSAEHGIGPANASQWSAVTPSATKGVLAAHRAQVDPLGILGHPDLPF